MRHTPHTRRQVDWTLEVAPANNILAWLSTLDVRTSAFLAPPRSTNLGIFGNGGPPGETGRDATTDG